MLQLQDVTKRYGDRPVLRGLSFAIEQGEVYGLLGPNGAGKTTTINIICSLLQKDSGWVEIAGQSASQRTKTFIGVAPQENLLYHSLSCAENLSFFARIYGLSARERPQRIQACLAAVNLSDRADSIVSTLSGGMQRRLSIAIALVHTPQLVILDEPTTGLDIETRYDIWRLIKGLAAQNIAVLLTTHLLDEAEHLCDRIGILKGGKIRAEGTLQQLQQRFVLAKEVLLIESPDEATVVERGRQRGWVKRSYGNQLAFWLPEALELGEIMQVFDGIPLSSISRQPVRLEHIYLEVTQPAVVSL